MNDQSSIYRTFSQYWHSISQDGRIGPTLDRATHGVVAAILAHAQVTQQQPIEIPETLLDDLNLKDHLKDGSGYK